MKGIALIFFIFLSLENQAQKGIFGPQRNDNVIVVTTDTLYKNVIQKAASVLISQGFTIDDKNTGNDTLSTNPYSYDNGKLIIHLRIISNEIRIYGMFEPNLAIISGANKPRQITRKIYYLEAEENQVRKAWNIMDAFANQLAQVLQASVTYLKW
jgi:hypothetical protein